MDPKAFAVSADAVRQRLTTLLESLTTVRELSALNMHHQDESALLDNALKMMGHHQNLGRCSVFLLRDDTLVWAAGGSYGEGGLFQHEHGTEGPRADCLTGPHRVGEGIIGLAAETGELQWCQDCGSDPLFGRTEEGGGALRGSLMCAPMLNGVEVLGVVSLHQGAPGYFQDQHRNLLVLFCDLLGRGLANNRVMAHLGEAVEQSSQQAKMALAAATDLKRRYGQLSIIDELTGLHNRRFFLAHAASVLAHSIRHGEPFCLLLLGLDLFREVNDAYGQAAGDATLRGLARVLQRNTRQDDVLARFGGDQFVLALPGIGLEGAQALSVRIGDYIRNREWKANRQSFAVTVSMGITQAETGTRVKARRLLEQLIKQAEEALNQSVQNGRDQYSVYYELLAPEKTAVGS